MRALLALVVASVISIGVVAALLLTGSPERAESRTRSVDPFTYGDPEFCEPDKPVEDFGLSELPPLREAPELDELPFAPKTVSLDLVTGPILLGGESVGFWVHSQNFYGRTPLRWVLRHRIRPVDSAGHAGSVIDRGRKRVRTIRAADEVKSRLSTPRIPGFYRYDMEIADFDGRLLATYGSYLRVERKFWDPRLGLNGDEFRPGERVLSRVENFGTEPIGFGEEFGVQRYRGGSWENVRGPSEGGWLFWLGFVRAGWSGRCSAAQIPRDAPPGRYRILKEIGRGAAWPAGGRSYWLTAPFEIVD